MSAQQNYYFTEGWSATDGADKRILFNVEFNNAFKKRESVSGTDPLWVRIESDPIIKQEKADGSYVSDYNSVRQVTLNFNVDNTTVEGDHYKDRPYVIFYTGPENIDYAKDENGVLIRHSQPVVLNLNKDTNAIIYMPNSPVIINGNNHALHGFVIAKCYLQAVTREDLLGTSSFTQYDGFNTPETFEAGYLEGTDIYGNTIYVKSTKLSTMEELEQDYANCKFVTDTETGEVSVYEELASEYPIISFTKDLYTNCNTLDEYFAKTAEYINSNYTKAKYAQYAGIDESQVSMIKFPDETFGTNYHNFTAVSIPVKTADLLDSDPDPNASVKDDKYVKVMLGEAEKYIHKSKLPHMRIKRNEYYPYVCLYDLKTGLGNKREEGFAGVNPTDDSITPSSDKSDNSSVVFLNNGNEYKNVWVINVQLLEKTYYNEYTPDKLKTHEKDGFKYFMLNTDLIEQYRKFVVGVEADGKEIVEYFKYGTSYYTKVDNNIDDNGNVVNYIIVDENGNILTKPVTAPEVLDVDTEAKNNSVEALANSSLSYYYETYTRDPKNPEELPSDNEYGQNGRRIVDGKYRGWDEAHLTRDYRIPALERVYKMSTFKLNSNSCYSYFDIEELKRVNYLYLNVDEINEVNISDSNLDWKVEDMFFTTTRSGWID